LANKQQVSLSTYSWPLSVAQTCTLLIS
jgi:hypothetical protein